MKPYHIWITAMTSMYEGDIIRGLIMKGYVVCSAGPTISIKSESSIACVIGLRVEKDKLDIPSADIYTDVTFVLQKIEAKYYSIVITEFSQQATWGASNIVLNSTVEEIKPVDRKLN